MNANAIKRKIAQVFDVFGINSLGHFVQRSALFPFIRVINYHVIPAEHAANFAEHLKFYSSRFINVDEEMLRDFLNGKKWPHDKPGLIISFDDGTRDHVDIAAPLLEQFGFTGWFFVPSGWVTDRSGEKAEFVPQDVEPLTHQQLRYLDEHHVVGCHTETHCRLTADLSEEKLRFETVDAKKHLEELVGHKVTSFCWVGGEEYTYNAKAAEFISYERYGYAFMTNSAPVTKNTNSLQLQRTNIEAENPLPLVRFQLSGFLDLMYYGKRKRVNALTEQGRIEGLKQLYEDHKKLREDKNNQGKCLVVFFGEKVEMAWGHESDISRGFDHKNETYTVSDGDDGNNGFYDWLRTKDRTLIGVRFFGFENTYFLAEHLQDLPYIKIGHALDDSPILDIYFSDERKVDESLGGDQDFGWNWLFKTASGKLAMSFFAEDVIETMEDQLPRIGTGETS
jgi:peptidoglycan/xylan/chitin deacetylase (PgdA/CDA1 family)